MFLLYVGSLYTHTYKSIRTTATTVNICNFPIIHRKWFFSTITIPKLPWVTWCFLTTSSPFSSLSPPFFSLVCLFPWCFYLRHQTIPPARSLPHVVCPPPPPPRRPRAVRMICKLQKTKSPSLVSTAHLGNSISQGGQALQRTASPSCSLRPCSSEWSLCGLSATHVSLWRRELPLSK